MCNAHTFAFGPARTDIFARELIEGPPGRAHRRPTICDLYFGTGLQTRKKHAIRNGRLQEDGIIMTCLRRILQMLLALRICVM